MRHLTEHRSSARVALLLGALVLIRASGAHAQTKGPTPPPATAAPAPHDAFKDTARELFDRAVKAMEEQRWEDCRASFLAALNIHQSYQIAGNLAFCETKLGRVTDAAEHAALSLREMPADAPPDRKAGAEAVFKEVRPKVAELSIRVSKPDAEVFVDGRSMGRAPLAAAVFVEAGDHKLEARLGGATARAALTAKGGGTHEIALTFDEQRPPEGWKPPLALVLASGGLALAGIGAGAGLTVAANGKAEEAKTLRAGVGDGSACTPPTTAPARQCATLLEAWTTQGTLSNAALGAFVAGGALSVATVALLVWNRSKSDSARIGVAPAVSAQSAGLLVRGQW